MQLRSHSKYLKMGCFVSNAAQPVPLTNEALASASNSPQTLQGHAAARLDDMLMEENGEVFAPFSLHLQEWTRYVDDVYGFQFLHPSQWRVSTSSNTTRREASIIVFRSDEVELMLSFVVLCVRAGDWSEKAELLGHLHNLATFETSPTQERLLPFQRPNQLTVFMLHKGAMLEGLSEAMPGPADTTVFEVVALHDAVDRFSAVWRHIFNSVTVPW